VVGGGSGTAVVLAVDDVLGSADDVVVVSPFVLVTSTAPEGRSP
jgi:hypothetical protein